MRLVISDDSLDLFELSDHVSDFIRPRSDFLFEQDTCLSLFRVFIRLKLSQQFLVLQEPLDLTLKEAETRVDPVGTLRGHGC